VNGIIQGTGSTSGNDFTSTNGIDFGFSGLRIDTDFDGSFAVQSTLDGTFTTEGSSQSWNADYDSDYELTPDPNDIAGAYNGSSINYSPFGSTPRTAQFIIGSAGSIAVSGLADCNNVQGTITPHSAGNVFDFSGTISEVDCIPNELRDVSGVAFFNVTTQTLRVTAVDGPRAHAYYLTGVRQ
jgi:hypothetical protein